MRHKLPRILLLAAWLVATGGLWDVVQAVAWARMFSNEVTTVSFSEAAENTFSAGKQCSMCLLVERGKRTQDDNGVAFAALVSKAPVVFQSVARIVVSSPPGVPLRGHESGFGRFRREVPPVPPPRVGEV